MTTAQPDYDVIIVGAGPAGATTAKYLLDHLPNLRVLILEKSSQLPRQKPCGGYIGSELFELFPYLQGHEKHFVESESYRGILHSPDLRYQVSGRTHMLGVLRHTFDAYLSGLAQQVGAQIGTRSRVINLKLHSDEILIQLQDGRKLTTKIVVGADGVTSIVARRTGLHGGWKPHQICKTVVKELPVDPNFILDQYGPDRPVHLFLQFNQIPGYAWVFPKVHSINFGLGCFANTPVRLIDYFHLLVRILTERAMIPPNASLENVQAGICPTAGPLNITQGERVLLVGDAAGFVSPLTGAGIVWGMLSGQLAAQTLVEAFNHNRFDASYLNRYQRRWEQRIGRFRT
ncbi:MAG: NAD(P)/FAD-dependent oxidoreductase, partial [Candidatus Hermodarchaeota archaeon]|nr:NAD(P)/FAD-dependent oxidoreductase [Candidatus Hermodarchaeota archaeon]